MQMFQCVNGRKKDFHLIEKTSGAVRENGATGVSVKWHDMVCHVG